MEKMTNCNLCPRKCNVDRQSKLGFCKGEQDAVVALASLHLWEEPCISFGAGSGTIFFSGCNLKCCYCQNYEISNNIVGTKYSAEQLAQLFQDLENKGAVNINLVTPSHYITQIVKTLQIYKPKVPVVYNSSGYESVEALQLIDKFVDIYLVDFKYYSNDLASELSKASDYKENAIKAISFMCQSKKDIFDGEKMLQGVIIRHLILPNNLYNTYQVLQYISENRKDRLVSLMAQYIPMGKAKKMPKLNRKISKTEYDKAVSKFIELNLNGFIQEQESANESFVPKFCN